MGNGDDCQEGWGLGSVSEVYEDLRLHITMQKFGHGNMYLPSTGEAETGGSPEFTGQLV